MSNRPLAALGSLLLCACGGFHPLTRPSHGQDVEPVVAPATAATAEPGAAKVDTAGWRILGQSVRGRPLRVRAIGSGPRRVLWIGGIHGNEREGSVATSELPAAFAARPGATEGVTLWILEDANPDGSAASSRGNANGVDLNRNFPSTNFVAHRMNGIRPLSQPESQIVHDLVLRFRPHLVIVAHSWHDDRFINWDGPAEALAVRFSRLSSYPVRKSEEISPTPGSMGSWLGRTLGTAILTLEYRRGRDPWSAWQETREAILGVILSDETPTSVATDPDAEPAANAAGRAARAVDQIGDDDEGGAVPAPPASGAATPAPVPPANEAATAGRPGSSSAAARPK